jgi:hypothetical protein
VIDQVCGCSVTAFQSQYLETRRPVVITGLAEGWPALSQWSPAVLANRFGERTVEVRRAGKLYRTLLKNYVRYLDGQAARLWNSGPQSQSQELIYLHALVLPQTLPELLDEFAAPPHFLPNWMTHPRLAPALPAAVRASAVLFVGPAGVGSATHRDRFHTHAWLTQIYGEKQVWLISPERHHESYQNPQDQDRSLADNFEDLAAGRYPLLKPESVASLTLRPGDTLFIPAGWWHGAKCLTTSISLSENFMNRTNFSEFCRDFPLPPETEEYFAVGQECC